LVETPLRRGRLEQQLADAEEHDNGQHEQHAFERHGAGFPW
jgi:hypothetical protein